MHGLSLARTLIASACLLAIALPQALPAAVAAGDTRLRLAVLGLRPLAGVEEQEARGISDFLEGEINALGAYHVLGPEDVRAMLTLEAQRQLLSCNEEGSCIAEIAGALGAQRAVHGSLSRIGGSILVLVVLLDTDRAQVVAKVSRRVTMTETLEPVLDALPVILRELAAKDAGARERVRPVAASPPPAGAATVAGADTAPIEAPEPAPGEATDFVAGPRGLSNYRLYLYSGSGTRGMNAQPIAGPVFGAGVSWQPGIFELALSSLLGDYGPRAVNPGGLSMRAEVRLAFQTRVGHRYHVAAGTALLTGAGFGFRTALGAEFAITGIVGSRLVLPFQLGLEVWGEHAAVLLTSGLGFAL